MAANCVVTVPGNYFDSWDPKPLDGFDERIQRYMGMHDGTTLRSLREDNQGEVWAIETGPNRGKPWFWTFATPMGHPKKLVEGESVCFITFKGTLIGYFDVVGLGIGADFWAQYDTVLAKLPTAQNKCVALANFHPGNYGPLRGFQGFRYIDRRP